MAERSRLNTMMMGVNPVIVDTVAATIMGLDPGKLPLIREAYGLVRFKITDCSIDKIRVSSNRADWCGDLKELGRADTFRFRPHFGWTGKIERN